MTIDQSTQARRTADPGRLAAAARSILSCPGDVQLVVDGVDDIGEGLDPEVPGGEALLRMHDVAGHPVFSCPPGAALARAAHEGRNALLTVASALGEPGSQDRDATLTLTGALEATVEECTCCDDLRTRVTILPSLVLLARATHPTQRLRVPLTAYGSADHHLNRGFLQRAVEHANDCHQSELRHALATTADLPMGQIAGVQLTGLRPDRVDLQWVDSRGAHHATLRFARTARTPEELGDLLREELHAGLC